MRQMCARTCVSAQKRRARACALAPRTSSPAHVAKTSENPAGNAASFTRAKWHVCSSSAPKPAAAVYDTTYTAHLDVPTKNVKASSPDIDKGTIDVTRSSLAWCVCIGMCGMCVCVYARARADVSVHVSDIHCYGISVVHESSMAIRPTLTRTRAHAVRTLLSLHWHLTESVVGSISATTPSPVPTRSSPVGASAVHSTPYDMRVFVCACVRVFVCVCVCRRKGNTARAHARARVPVRAYV